MKILMVHNRYQLRGGEDESYESECRILRQKGHQVDSYEEDNSSIPALGLVKVGIRTLWSQHSYRKVKEVLGRERYDLMHVQNFFPLISPAIYYAARRSGVPVVQSLRNYRLLCPNAIFFRDHKPCEDCLHKAIAWPGVMHACYRGSRAATLPVAAMASVHRALGTWLRQVDRYIALTEFAKRKFIEGGLPARKLTTKPNFVHPDPRPGSGDGNFAIFVGRLSQEKGVATLLAAWQRVGQALPLKIVGDGPMTVSVHSAAQALHGVELLGRKSVAELYDLIGRATVLILPSEWYETFGRVAIEAFAKGTPVIASDLGAMRETVVHGITGLHFKAGDPADLTEKVLWYLHCADRALFRKSARHEFEMRYTAEANYIALMNIYADALRSSLTPSKVEELAQKPASTVSQVSSIAP